MTRNPWKGSGVVAPDPFLIRFRLFTMGSSLLFLERFMILFSPFSVRSQNVIGVFL
jgi:hypothetical protein